MPRSSAERSAPVPQEAGQEALLKQIDARTKRLGIRQTRGEGADPNMERVSVVDEDGKERFVSMSRKDLKKAEQRADKDFERAISAVTAGEKLDPKAVAELMGSNKEQILTLARKEADVHGAVFKVMEDAVEAYKEYDKMVDKAVKESGYTGIVADGLRTSLLEQRGRVFSDAFASSAGPRAKRNLESAVIAKVRAESARRINELNETVGSPAEMMVQQTAEEIRSDIARLDGLTSGAEANALDRQIQKQTADWARAYLRINPDASPKDVMREAKSAGLDEHINGKDIGRIKDGLSKEELYQPTVDIVRQGAVRSYAEAPAMEPAIVDDGSYDKRLGLSKADKARAEGEPEVIDMLGDIRAEIARLDGMEAGAEANRLDDKILKQTAAWAKEYLSQNPDVSSEDVIDKAEQEGVDGYLTGRDVERLMKGASIEKLHKADGRTDVGLRARRDALARLRRDSRLENMKDLPTNVPADEWAEPATEIDENSPLARSRARTVFETMVPPLLNTQDREPSRSSDGRLEEGARAQADEIPDVTADLEDDEPGFMQRLASSGLGKWVRRGMLALGLGAAANESVDVSRYQQPSSQGGAETHQVAYEAESPRTMSEPTPEGKTAAPSVDGGEAKKDLPTKAEVAAKRQVRKPGDVRNLEDAMKIFEGMPGKKEYQKMQAAERVAQVRASLEDIKMIHDTLNGPNSAIEASKRIDLERKIEQQKAFLSLVRDMREL